MHSHKMSSSEEEYTSDSESISSSTFSSTSGDPSKSCTLYVGKLPPVANETNLREHFTECRIVGLHVIRDKETKLPKGFAFIRLESEEAADRAVTMYHKTRLLGKHPIVVSKKIEKNSGKKERNGKNTRRRKREGSSLSVASDGAIKDADSREKSSQVRLHQHLATSDKYMSSENIPPPPVPPHSHIPYPPGPTGVPHVPVPPSPVPPPSPDREGPVAVTLSNIPIEINEPDISDLVSRYLPCSLTFNSHFRTASIVLPSHQVASQVVRDLDGQILLGSVITASISTGASHQSHHRRRKSSTEAKDNNDSIKITNLPAGTKRGEVRSHFASYGPIDMCSVKKQRQDSNTCYSIVKFKDPRAAINATTCDGSSFKGQPINVSLREQQVSDNSNSIIIVSGLSTSTSDSDVFHSFKSYGFIISRVKITESNPRSCSITYSSRESAERAVRELNHTPFKGSVLSVQHCSNDDNEDDDESDVLVSGLSTSTSDSDVFHSFKSYGFIIGRVKITESNPRSCSITYSSRESAERAVREMNHTPFKGSVLSVQHCSNDDNEDDDKSDVLVSVGSRLESLLLSSPPPHSTRLV